MAGGLLDERQQVQAGVCGDILLGHVDQLAQPDGIEPDLLDDVQGQFENSDNFHTQQKQVSALEERLMAGKEKADALTARLAEAKERVDRRARREAQWEASTNRTSSHLP